MERQYKLARKMKKITLTAAAKELGVSQPTLSAWEGGRKNPSIDSLIRMSEYYGVSVDFLLGLEQEHDPRRDLMRPISARSLPALHETPVFSPLHGWAFVDVAEQQLRFAGGLVLPFADAPELYILPPSFSAAAAPQEKPLDKGELRGHDEIWVEPISSDAALRAELRGWYRVKARYVENEVGQRFYFDFYGAKWLAFASADDENK